MSDETIHPIALDLYRIAKRLSATSTRDIERGPSGQILGMVETVVKPDALIRQATTVLAQGMEAVAEADRLGRVQIYDSIRTVALAHAGRGETDPEDRARDLRLAAHFESAITVLTNPRDAA